MEDLTETDPVGESALRYPDGRIEFIGADDQLRIWARVKALRAERRGKATWVVRQVDEAGNATPWVPRER
jgi:hypothetical protein